MTGLASCAWCASTPRCKRQLGCEDGVPSEWACYRFARKLRDHGDMLDRCIRDVIAALQESNPELGRDVAIDGSDMPAYANGQRYVSSRSSSLPSKTGT